MQLVADNLCLDRGGRRIVEAVSFVVGAGEALVLSGPNGAGKTSLLRAIVGFLPPAAGQVRLIGGEEDSAIAEQCHFAGHRDGVKAGLTVRENGRFFAQYLGETDTHGVMAALDRLGLAGLADIPAAYLSAGQRRRLGLTRLLLARRPLWLLDEPTASLDAASAATLVHVISDHRAGGGLLVAATHVPLGLTVARELQLGEAGGGAPAGLPPPRRSPRDASP